MVVGNSGTAATSVLAASRQLQGKTEASETPTNTDEDRSASSAAMMLSERRCNSASYTSKNTAVKLLTNSPARTTTARAVKLAGGVPTMLTETEPVDVACRETTCSSVRAKHTLTAAVEIQEQRKNNTREGTIQHRTSV
jgi:hypothetical protein